MTQMTLGVSVPQANKWGDENKCIFCGEDEHENAKKDKIKPTNWKRAKIEGVGGNNAAYKLSLYPNNQSPPSIYTSEGHHCVAFSSFIRDARTSPRDFFAPLNHYLAEQKYDPNNKNNTIDLPGRKEKNDSDPNAQFKNFEKAATATPPKPMQLHIGGHKSDLMQASDKLVQRVYNTMKKPGMCKKPDDEWKKKLLEKMKKMEDKAFDKTASVTSPFICHPGPLRNNRNNAEDYVQDKHDIQIVYPKKQGW